jgi:hypothetical protein
MRKAPPVSISSPCDMIVLQYLASVLSTRSIAGVVDGGRVFCAGQFPQNVAAHAVPADVEIIFQSNGVTLGFGRRGDHCFGHHRRLR